MICQFTFENYKSFRDEVTLDFQATNIHEFDESLLSSKLSPQKKILPVAAIYGPNGGGKSGVLEALSSLVGFILRPIEMQSNDLEPLTIQPRARIVPFKLDEESRKRPTKFELFFRTETAEYRYRVSLERISGFKEHYNELIKISDESLYRRKLTGKNTAMLFIRNADGIKVGGTIKVRAISDNIRSSMPLLSFLYNTYKIDAISDAVGWFKSCLVYYSNYSEYPRLDRRNSAKKLYDIKDREKDIDKIIMHMDLGIKDIHVIREHVFFPEELEEQTLYSMNLIHQVREKKYLLPESEESAGTQKILNLISDLVLSLQDGRMLIADELDANLHPKLLEQIILFYKNPKINIGGGQLLFTSHDLSTMNNRLFRRDEIWFAAKDESESSILYSLSEIKDEKGSSIRSDASYGKQYLNGRFGADPYFKRMLEWGSNDKQAC